MTYVQASLFEASSPSTTHYGHQVAVQRKECWVHSKMTTKKKGEMTNTSMALKKSPETKSFASTVAIQDAIDIALREVREILHRRGRFSSRSESLDELAKLIFAQVITAKNTGLGLCRDTLKLHPELSPAEVLCAFVDDAVRSFLPNSLSHEMGPDDFALKIKPQEDKLALELIDCFERNIPASVLCAENSVDFLNEVFGKFLSDSFVDEKQLGQYLTPPEVVQLMVHLALKAMDDDELSLLTSEDHCAEFGYILDPSCGVGSFLSEVVRALTSTTSVQGTDSTQHWIEQLMSNVIVGVDKSERMVRLALTNMAMFGCPVANLHLANALTKSGRDGEITSSLNGKVKLILTNPPFGAEFEGSDLAHYKIASSWARSRPNKVNSEVLFMERYLEWLAPGGQLLAIVPDSILTNKGLFEDLRNGLLPDVDICSVISLPVETFGAAGTTTKTSILHLKKRSSKSEARQLAFFAICKDIGFTITTKDNHRLKKVTSTGDLPAIVESLDSVSEIDGLTRWVEKNLINGRWDASYYASVPKEIEERLLRKVDFDVRLSDVAELSKDRADPRRWSTETFQYIEISDVDPDHCMVSSKEVPCKEAPSRARKVVRAGDILFSTVRPDRKAIGVVQDAQAGAVCTTGFAVIRPKGIDALTLAYLLKTDFVTSQVMRNNIGIAYPAVDETCLPDLLLPIRRDDINKLADRARELLALERKLHSLRNDFQEGVQEAVESWAGS